MRTGLLTASFATVLSALALAACGGGDSSSSSSSSTKSEHENTNPPVAVEEVGETRDALKAALKTYKEGDAAGAQEQVAEAYVSHFEEVERALDAKNHELMEDLEHAISDELRSDMKAGKPAAAIEAQVKSIVADLDKAEAALR
jgi:hypothetical protein